MLAAGTSMAGTSKQGWNGSIWGFGSTLVQDPLLWDRVGIEFRLPGLADWAGNRDPCNSTRDIHNRDGGTHRTRCGVAAAAVKSETLSKKIS